MSLPRSTRAGAPHLVAALIAGALFVIAIVAFSSVTNRAVERQIYKLAGSRYAQKDLGLAVQTAALKSPDLLPVFGSSEIDRPSLYHARDVFADAPTGFSVLTVAGPGTPVLETLQNLAALGRDLRGKKVVISLSPPMFLLQAGPVLTERYDGNFSPLHALTALLSANLSRDLKQWIARGLLTHPGTLERNSTLELTTRLVADDSPASRMLYGAILPLAQLQRLLLKTQDQILVLGHLASSPSSTTDVRRRVPRTLDWPAMLADATAQTQAHATNNPFGVDSEWWDRHQEWVAEQANTRSDERFLSEFANSTTSAELEQVMRLLHELGADPLLLSMPFYAPFLEYTGVSKAVWHQDYGKVRDIAARYGARTAILDDHERDRSFFYDLYSHPGPKGWIRYDQALDAFYHDTSR